MGPMSAAATASSSRARAGTESPRRGAAMCTRTATTPRTKWDATATTVPMEPTCVGPASATSTPTASTARTRSAAPSPSARVESGLPTHAGASTGSSIHPGPDWVSCAGVRALRSSTGPLRVLDARWGPAHPRSGRARPSSRCRPWRSRTTPTCLGALGPPKLQDQPATAWSKATTARSACSTKRDGAGALHAADRVPTTGARRGPRAAGLSRAAPGPATSARRRRARSSTRPCTRRASPRTSRRTRAPEPQPRTPRAPHLHADPTATPRKRASAARSTPPSLHPVPARARIGPFDPCAPR